MKTDQVYLIIIDAQNISSFWGRKIADIIVFFGTAIHSTRYDVFTVKNLQPLGTSFNAINQIFSFRKEFLNKAINCVHLLHK